jgi:hypothetical protein
MNRLLPVAFGWLVPGGAFLLQRRYLQFAGFSLAVSAAFAAGLLLGGTGQWPQPAELAGLDGFTALGFRASAFVKLLAGGPWLIASLFNGPSFLEGRLHEYGTTLIMMAGVCNVLAIAGAHDVRSEVKG